MKFHQKSNLSLYLSAVPAAIYWGLCPQTPTLAGSPYLSAPFGRKPSALAYGVTNSESVMWSLISCGSSDQIFLKTA